MPRLPIHHTTLTYAGRELLTPGADLSLGEIELSLPWSYGTEVVPLVNAARPIITDSGNASGELSLPIVQDYPTITAALTALIELKAWADAHPTGALSLALTHPPAAPPPTTTTRELTTATPTGTENLNARYFELDPRYVPTGALSSITLACRSNDSTIAVKARYLGIWEQTANGGEFVKLGASIDEVLQQPGESRTWHFDPAAISLHGRKLRLCMLDSPTAAWQNNYVFGLRVIPTPSGESSLCYYSSEVAYTPEVSITAIVTTTSTPEGTLPTPPPLTYHAGLQTLNTRLTLAPRGYRLTSEWHWLLT